MIAEQTGTQNKIVYKGFDLVFVVLQCSTAVSCGWACKPLFLWFTSETTFFDQSDTLEQTINSIKMNKKLLFIYNVAIALKEKQTHLSTILGRTRRVIWKGSRERKVNSWANSSITWQNSMVRNHTWNKSNRTPLYVNIQLQDKFPFR